MGKTLFVTGKLASKALEKILKTACIEGDVFVLPIDVAALATTRFITRYLSFTLEYDLIMIPGLCTGDSDIIEERTGIKTVKGPQDLLDLPEHFGGEREILLNDFDMRIFAEINDIPSLTLGEIRRKASYYVSSGADVIDLGCSQGKILEGVGRIISVLKDEGFTLSIDTLNPEEIMEADESGVDYVLSLNSQNLALASRLESVPVLIPDRGDMASLERNISSLKEIGKRHIIDPLLAPLNFGFTESVGRFLEIRRRHPEAEMLAGVGNVVELCDADSVGMHALLTGMLSELGVRNVLTTEASQKTRGAVRELDIARRMMFYAKKNAILPRRITDELLVVKEVKGTRYTEQELREMQKALHPRDGNIRIFVSDKIYAFNGSTFVSGNEKKEILSKLTIKDADHAFYMGKELERAELALKLGKRYIQEQELNWGYIGRGSERGN